MGSVALFPFLFSFLFLSVTSFPTSPTTTHHNHGAMKILCRRRAFVTLSPACLAYLSRNAPSTSAVPPSPSKASFIPSITLSNHTINNIHTVKKHTHTTATIIKTLASIGTTISSIYAAIVAYLKIKKGLPMRRALSLNMFYGRHASSADMNASTLPIPLSDLAVSTI